MSRHERRATAALERAGILEEGEATAANRDYWYGLINERAMAEYLGLSQRTLQGYRVSGDGPVFVRVSSRCIRYRRADGREWLEARLCRSTADAGQEASCHAQ